MNSYGYVGAAQVAASCSDSQARAPTPIVRKPDADGDVPQWRHREGRLGTAAALSPYALTPSFDASTEMKGWFSMRTLSVIVTLLSVMSCSDEDENMSPLSASAPPDSPANAMPDSPASTVPDVPESAAPDVPESAAPDVPGFASLEEAVQSTLTAGTTISVSRAYTVGDLIIPPDRTLLFENGGRLYVREGTTLTIQGKILSVGHQIFFGTGAVSLPASRPEWFGADLTGVNDGTAATQLALDSAPLTLINGTVLVTSPLKINSNSTVHFEPAAHIIAAHPVSNSSWSNYTQACTFVNKNGYNTYQQKKSDGELTGSYYRGAPSDLNIRFTGHGYFTTTTLDESANSNIGAGAWAAICLLYAENFTIESIETDVLNGTFFFESGNGHVDSLIGRNIRNSGAVGGCAQVGWNCENISFGSITGWRNHTTFVVDAGQAVGINVGNLLAGDADSVSSKDWPPVSKRHVELTGVQAPTVANLQLNGGGTYQGLILSSGCTGAHISGTIRNSYGEALRIQNSSDNSVKMQIIDPWKGDASFANHGYKINSNGELTSDAVPYVRPAVFVYHASNGRPDIRNNFLEINFEKRTASSYVTAGILEAGYSGSQAAGNLNKIFQNDYLYYVNTFSFPALPNQFFGLNGMLRTPHSVVDAAVRSLVSPSASVVETQLGDTIYPLSNQPDESATPISLEARYLSGSPPTTGSMTVRVLLHSGVSDIVLGTIAVSTGNLNPSISIYSHKTSALRCNNDYFRVTYQTDAAWNGAGASFEIRAHVLNRLLRPN